MITRATTSADPNERGWRLPRRALGTRDGRASTAAADENVQRADGRPTRINVADPPPTHQTCVGLCAEGPSFAFRVASFTGAALAKLGAIRRAGGSAGKSAPCTFSVGPFAIQKRDLFADRVQSSTPLRSVAESVREAKGCGLAGNRSSSAPRGVRRQDINRPPLWDR